MLERFLPYVERELAAGAPLRSMTRHLLGLRTGQAGGRRWRRDLSELPDGYAGLERLHEIAAQVDGKSPVHAAVGVSSAAAFAFG